MDARTLPTSPTSPTKVKPHIRNGIVLWEGASALDGAPLVCVATGLRTGSKNGKTGALVQTFIMRRDVSPADCLRTGQDFSVCGQCRNRPILGGKCYVQVPREVTGVWLAYKRGRYLRDGDAGWSALHARASIMALRAGSWGDPALVPLAVWRRLNVVTGYTHQWRSPWAAGHRDLFMASADSSRDMEAARAKGWRSFLVLPHGTTEGPAWTVLCPSKRGVACEDCRLCGGLQRAGAKDVWIPEHGFRVRTKGDPSGMEAIGPTLEPPRNLLRVLQ